MILCLFGATIGPGARAYPTAKIWAPWNLIMEENSCLGPDVECYNVAPIHLGRDSIVSQRSFLCTASHDFEDKDFSLIGSSIIISQGAWIAAESFVGPGITVNQHAVVLARSVVTRDVAANTVVAGNPAQYIRERFSRN